MHPTLRGDVHIPSRLLPIQNNSESVIKFRFLLTYQINHFSHKIIEKKQNFPDLVWFVRATTTYKIYRILLLHVCCTYNLFVPKKKLLPPTASVQLGFCVRNAIQTNPYCIIWEGGSIAIMLTRKCIY